MPSALNGGPATLHRIDEDATVETEWPLMRCLSLVRFYGRRAARIVRMALLVIVLAMIAERFIGGAVLTHHDADGARWSAVFLANFHTNFHSRDVLVLGSGRAVLSGVSGHGARGLISLKAVDPPVQTVRCSSVIALLSFSWSGLHPALAYSAPWGRAWELAVGGLLSVATGYLKPCPHRR